MRQDEDKDPPAVDELETADQEPDFPPGDQAPDATANPPNRALRYLLLLVALTFLAYLPIFFAGFVFDDVETLVKNTRLFETPPARLFFTPEYFPASKEASYRPLGDLTFLLDHAIWGWRPFGWHL
ncbi:MAG: hypothetical protein NTW86_00980, partial [Candidatus Sumerlaeota bacterium]|nr:hypothetical protein [Candidatus Sumerlaeota bacterium]